MNKKKTTIELNGRQYDARTGALLSDESTPLKGDAANIDGVVRQTKNDPQPALSAPVQKAPLQPLSKKPVMDVTRLPAPAVTAHQPEHAKTLMRRSVRKPEAAIVPKALGMQTTPAQGLAVKKAAARLDQSRLARAQATEKSTAINRFGVIEPRAAQAATTPPVEPVAITPVAPLPSTPLARQPSMDIFERAIARATTHEALPLLPAKKKRFSHRGLTAVASASLAIVIIGGFLVYKNVPNVTLYVASSKAGFSASLPGYQPSGYTLGKVAAAPGTVAVNYTSNSDSRAYSLNEKPSNWDSATLRDSYVVAQVGQHYETVQSAGRTIYIFGKGTATWVNGGIWYIVRTNGSLSTEQLLTLADSI